MPLIDDYAANNDRIAQLQQQLLRYKGQVVSRPALVAQTVELKNDILSTKVFSVQKSIPLVLAELQEKIKTVITAAGGELSSTQSLAQKPVDGLIKLGINASFSSKISSLKTILYELESAKPYMMFENIKIYAANTPHHGSGKIDATNKIMVIADIVTYIPPMPK